MGFENYAFENLAEAEQQAIYAKFQELIPPRPVPEKLPPHQQSTIERENGSSTCRDKLDNDEDGLIDQNDPECAMFYREVFKGPCMDDRDNDLDGLIDEADPDCAQYYPQPAPQPPPPPTATITS